MEVEVADGDPQPPAESRPVDAQTLAKWPRWRRHFFGGWCQSGGGRVHALCRLCRNRRFYVGNVSSLTNFKTHLERNHRCELAAFHSTTDAPT